jgi:hypothetical protein
MCEHDDSIRSEIPPRLLFSRSAILPFFTAYSRSSLEKVTSRSAGHNSLELELELEHNDVPIEDLVLSKAVPSLTGTVLSVYRNLRYGYLLWGAALKIS